MRIWQEMGNIKIVLHVLKNDISRDEDATHNELIVSQNHQYLERQAGRKMPRQPVSLTPQSIS